MFFLFYYTDTVYELLYNLNGSSTSRLPLHILLVVGGKPNKIAERFARNQWVAWHNTKNTVFVYIIKQLYHSLSSYMNSHATRTYGIIVKYNMITGLYITNTIWCVYGVFSSYVPTGSLLVVELYPMLFSWGDFSTLLFFLEYPLPLLVHDRDCELASFEGSPRCFFSVKLMGLPTDFTSEYSVV